MIFSDEKSASADKYARQREAMIKTQIIARGIGDEKTIRAMAKVPRHLFVPQKMRPYAYEDRALSIGHDQTISQPYIVAYMTEALKLQGNETVLEIGTGSGYQAAVLAEIVEKVYTVEILGQFDRVRMLFQELGYDNIEARQRDGYRGWREYAPFDAIIVTCSPNHIPSPLQKQLKVGGKMMIPVGEQWTAQNLVYLEKSASGQIIRRDVFPVKFVPMTGEIEKERD